jgi:polysaccharide biosynthesis transport protein
MRQDAETWTVAMLMAVLRRRRRLLLAPAACLLILAIAYCCVATRRWKATGLLEVQKDTPGSFGLETSVMGRDDSGMTTDSLDYNMTLQTEVGILESDVLAIAVIRDLKLEQTPDYFQPKPGGPRLPLAKLLFWRKPLEPLSVPIEEAPNRRYAASQIFAAHLKIKPQTGTRLIEVSYSDRDPERAAAVVNRLIEELAEFSFRQRLGSTLQGSAWLGSQMSDLRKQMEQLQGRATTLQRGTGMFGDDSSRNVVLERLEHLNETLATAESNRILKEAVDRVAASGDPELISSLSGNSSVGAVASVNNSLTLIQNLRAQEAQLRVELAESSERYGPSYPKIAELRAELEGVQRSIHEEALRLGQRAHTDFLIAQREEAGARAAFEQQKLAAGKLNDAAVAYGLAKQEADSSRDIYEGLLAKLKQAGVLEGMKASNIAIVSMASVPPTHLPSSPRVPLILAAAVVGGLLAGGFLVILRELTDETLQSWEGIEALLGMPLLAALPAFVPERRARRLSLPGGDAQPLVAGGPEGKLPALHRRSSSFAEGLRALRTSLLLSRSGEPPQVVLITSCLEGEGKTTLSLNLAALLAQGGARVLLVDADLRKPAISHYLGADGASGLATLLASADAPRPTQPVPALAGLEVICGDEAPPFPSELLSSPRMASLLAGWRELYDFIVLDSPPLLPVTDGALLSQMSDATLLVARHGATKQHALRRGAEILRRQHAQSAAIGVVMNAVPRHSSDFYEYFGYGGERTAHA